MSRKVRYAADAMLEKWNVITSIITCTKEVMFSPVPVCLSVCLSVNRITNKTTDQIFMKFLWNGWT